MSFGRKPFGAAVPEDSDAPAPIETPVAGPIDAPAAAAVPVERRAAPSAAPAAPTFFDRRRSVRADSVIRTDSYGKVRQAVFAALDMASALKRSADQVRIDIEAIATETIRAEDLPVTQTEQRIMVQEILHDMYGVGPIEPLLQDETVDDVMVNGPDQVYVERQGKLELTTVKFRDNAHVISVAQRIAASVGRRVDESSPMVDARLQDGSRVNVIIPPLAIDGASISIRKFSRKDLTLPRLVARGTLSPAMVRLLEIAAACRLNIIVSGGTGSGKTTMLNALSRYIAETDRIVTIEDAAELQLQQPHVVRLETRPPSIEGTGAINQGDLMRNALRMRPDRIILGETRGAEAFDVLQAMNTGHDGSMTTLHANSPRDAVTRLESMVMMANGNLPLYSIRHQIASAVNLIVQVERLRDGSRKITHITEIVGMEGEVIITQDLFHFAHNATAQRDDVSGTHESTGMRPGFADRARYYGMEAALIDAMRP